MNPRTVPLFLPLRLAAALACLLTCGAAVAQQAGAGADAKPIPLARVGAAPLSWRSAAEEPAWLLRSVPRPGAFGFGTVRRSNQLGLAMTRAETLAARDVQTLLTEHLTPICSGDQVAEVVEELLLHVELVEAVSVGPRRIVGARGPGQTIAAACLRWRIPIRKAVADLSPSLRGRIEWGLLRAVVPWLSVTAEPKWAMTPPRKEGQFRFVLTGSGRLPNEAEKAAMDHARRDAHRYLVEVLQPLVGAEVAVEIADRGLRRFAPVKRATWLREESLLKRVDPRWGDKKRKVTTAYTLWEIPVATLLADLSKASREKVRSVLRDAPSPRELAGRRAANDAGKRD